MNSFIFMFHLIMVGIFCKIGLSYKLGIDNLLKSNFQYKDLEKLKQLENNKKEEMIIYCEDWSCGELEWEFAKGDMQKIYTLVIPSQNEKKNEAEKNNLINLNSNNLLEWVNQLMKILYDDIIQLESIINQLQNIDYIHFIGEGSLVNLFDLSFISIMSYGYKNHIANLKSNKQNKQNISFNELDDYLKYQKFVKSLILSLLFIFTKNVKSVD